MGPLQAIARLALRNMRKRPADMVLMVLVIAAATVTLTLGLLLRGVSREPYLQTREATSGPDVVVMGFFPLERVDATESGLPAVEELTDDPTVVASSGPFRVASVDLEVGGRRVDAQAVGRDAAPVPVDQPDVLDGSWVEPGGIVVEAAFAEALGVAVGDTVLLDGASFQVVGAAVSAASAPYPDETCFVGPCTGDAGVLWLTDADVANLDVPPERISHVVNLQLSDPDTAQAFIDAHGFNQPPQPPAQSWQEITDAADSRYRHQRRALLVGSWVLAVLAVASMAVLVGSRTADQSRRVGLLKAVGATPLTVAGILLAEYVIVALVAAAVGLAGGWLIAPLLTDPAEGLLGTASSPRLSASSIGVVTAMALGVAIAATLGPAVRAARTSTAGALLAPTRPPRRIGWLIDLSARLPAWLLLGIRLMARRPRRTVLAAASVFVTVSGVVAVLGAHAEVDRGDLDLDSAAIDRLNQVLLVIGLALGVLAAINAIASTWAAARDSRRPSALARALGATPRQVSAALSAAQVLPALAGAVLGIPGGILLLDAVDPDGATMPPLWQLLVVVPVAALVVAALTAVPARLGARTSVVQVLRAEAP